MTVQVHESTFARLSPDELKAWDGAEAAGVSDCLERSMAMHAGISPLDSYFPLDRSGPHHPLHGR